MGGNTGAHPYGAVEGTAADWRGGMVSLFTVVEKFNSPSPPPQRMNERPSHPG